MTKNQLRQLAKIAEAKRTGGKQPRKNGSIATKPSIECQDLPETKVVELCQAETGKGLTDMVLKGQET